MGTTVSSGAPTPATYGGSSYSVPPLTNFALNFNAAAGATAGGFTPVSAQSNGVNIPTNSGTFGGWQSWGPGVTPGLLNRATAGLYNIAGNGLATVAVGGAASQNLIANLFSGWGNNLDDLAQQNANILQTAVNQSNNAKISGILGGAGGFLGGIGKLVGAFAGF